MLWENVRKLNEQGMTIILTTHYLEEAEEMCDQIAIINHGQVVARDSTANLVTSMDAKTLVIHPVTPLAEAPEFDGIDTEVRGDGSLALTYRSRVVSAETVLDRLRATGVAIRDLKSEEPDLQDVFLALTSSRGA